MIINMCPNWTAARLDRSSRCTVEAERNHCMNVVINTGLSCYSNDTERDGNWVKNNMRCLVEIKTLSALHTTADNVHFNKVPNGHSLIVQVLYLYYSTVTSQRVCCVDRGKRKDIQNLTALVS